MNEKYSELLEKQSKECKNMKDDEFYKLKSRHIFEISIFPKINEFVLGEEVQIIDMYNNVRNAYIENFNCNGTLFIKENVSDMGIDYCLKYVIKK